MHVPFCVTVCPYCDFNVYAGLEDTAGEYVDAVLAEAKRRSDTSRAVSSVFIGGGTPSLLPPALLARLMDGLRASFTVDSDAEVTLEANPEAVDEAYFKGALDAGVNRVSLGVQSFVPHVLAALGRTHTAEIARDASGAAREAGVANLSLDLIFGAPGESHADWNTSLEGALALLPDHVSCYSLTIEQGTAFGSAVASGRMTAPDDDEQAAKYEAACETLEPHLEHYEISNWGRPSVHNTLYWTQSDYVGLGAGAHSHAAGVRSWNRKRPADYVASAATDATAGSETLDAATQAEERVQLALRLLYGVDLDAVSEWLGRDQHAAATALAEAGLVTLDGGLVRLTRRGMLLENEVALRLCS